MSATLQFGTRASDLALWQVRHVVALWRSLVPGAAAEIVTLDTAGDALPDAPLERLEGTGFFTSTLERALLEGRIDVAVHSHKDLPVEETTGVVVAAVPERGPAEDVLCSRDGGTLDRLAPRARVGTSSPRRLAQMRALRPDLDYRPLRGNVPTRLERVARGELDAVVLARAGVERLGLGARISEVFTVDHLLPAPAQGALAVQARAGERELVRTLGALDHGPTRRAVLAEREVIHRLRGGCSIPLGAHARLDGETVAVTAGVFALDGTRALRVTRRDADPRAAGAAAAAALLEAGAGQILAALRPEPVRGARS